MPINPSTLAGARKGVVTQIARTTVIGAIAANTRRKGFQVLNKSTSDMYILFETTQSNTVSSTKHSVLIANNDLYEMPYPIYKGQISYVFGGTGAQVATTTELE